MNYHRTQLAVCAIWALVSLWNHNPSAFVGFTLAGIFCLQLLQVPLYASQQPSTPASPQTPPQRQKSLDPACFGCGGPVVTGDEIVRRRCDTCGPLPLDYIAYEPHP